MKKGAIVAHVIEQAIVDFSPKISALTDFSLPMHKKDSFPPKQI
jgi:hypothetical protein